MGAIPEWYSRAQAAKWLGTDVLTLEAHPDGLWWSNRGLAGIEAENSAQEQRNKRKGGAGKGYGR